MDTEQAQNFEIQRTVRTDRRFREIVSLLDAELAQRDGEDHSFYSQFNSVDDIEYAILAIKSDVPIGCGGLKMMDQECVEVKRMYVKVPWRGSGLAQFILEGLENWAAELGYSKCRLETGKRQPEAIAFYLKSGYHRIDNYLQYKGVENSLCFEKSL